MNAGFKTSLLIFLSSVQIISYGASFDCEKAASNIEKIICSSDEISNLDSELNFVYKISIKQNPDTEAIKLEQRKWIKEVRNICSDEVCLTTAYSKRIKELNSTIAGVTKPSNSNEDETPVEQKKVEENKNSYQIQEPMIENGQINNKIISAPPIELSQKNVQQNYSQDVVAQPALEIQNNNGYYDFKSLFNSSGYPIWLTSTISLLLILAAYYAGSRLIYSLIFSSEKYKKLSLLNKFLLIICSPISIYIFYLLSFEQFRNFYNRDKIAIIAIPILMIAPPTLPFGILYLMIYLWKGYSRKCPNCKVIFGRVYVDSEILDQQEGYKTVRRTDEIRMYSDNSAMRNLGGGTHVGNIIRHEQIHVTHTKSEEYYICCNCDYEWSEIVHSTSS